MECTGQWNMQTLPHVRAGFSVHIQLCADSEGRTRTPVRKGAGLTLTPTRGNPGLFLVFVPFSAIIAVGLVLSLFTRDVVCLTKY